MRKLFCLLLAVMLLGLCGCTAAPQETTAPIETTQVAAELPDPGEDGVINILMVGNSFCYYYVEELYGIAKAAGIDMRVCNVYYSGCSMEKHYNWWVSNISNYDFFVTDENGRNKTVGCSLEYCFQQGNWDVISFQGFNGIGFNGDESTVQAAIEKGKIHRDALIGRARELFPKAEIYWHQTWAHEVGYISTSGTSKMESREMQENYHRWTKEFTLRICEEQGIKRIPSGDAWQLVRYDPLINDTLCMRLNVNNGAGDHYHDGDIGGAQYLNACVWFEVLTGQSCIGNTWRPENYPLTEEKIALFQEGAHQAVAAMNAG